MVSLLHDFVHARVDRRGCRIAGWMRVCYALLFLADRILLGWDLKLFYTSPAPLVTLDPSTNLWSLLRHYEPQKDPTVFLIVYHVAVAQGVLLLLGIAPRLQLSGILFHLVCLENHSPLLWDGQDAMLRTWALLLHFLPLHHVTTWRHHDDDDDDDASWPVWPFRVWQIYTSLVYLGASWGKLSAAGVWIGGEAHALYNCIHLNDVYPGLWDPEILFNRIGPLKVMTWTAVAVETACPFTIWVPGLRIITLIVVFLFHIGIEITMKMHCFEWLAMMGWCVFLVEPVKTRMTTTSTVSSSTTDKACSSSTTDTTTKTPTRVGWFQKVLDKVIFVTLISIFTADTVPLETISEMAPGAAKPFFKHMIAIRKTLTSTLFMRKLGEYGLTTLGPWDMFSSPADSNTYWKAIIHRYDGSVDVWVQPNWKEMSIWENKRHYRMVVYFDNLSDEDGEYGWVPLGVYIAAQHQPGVVSLELIREREHVPEMPPGLDFWEEARQPMTYSWELVLTLNARCWDSHPHCVESAEQGQCDHLTTRDMCPFSCGMCAFSFEIDYTQEEGEGVYDMEESEEEEEEEHLYGDHYEAWSYHYDEPSEHWYGESVGESDGDSDYMDHHEEEFDPREDHAEDWNDEHANGHDEEYGYERFWEDYDHEEEYSEEDWYYENFEGRNENDDYYEEELDPEYEEYLWRKLNGLEGESEGDNANGIGYSEDGAEHDVRSKDEKGIADSNTGVAASADEQNVVIGIEGTTKRRHRGHDGKISVVDFRSGGAAQDDTLGVDELQVDDVSDIGNHEPNDHHVRGDEL